MPGSVALVVKINLPSVIRGLRANTKESAIHARQMLAGFSSFLFVAGA